MTDMDDKSPMISVLLPVHNADPYLALAIDSLLEQTFKDFEIIAINDGSTDLSGEILNEYAIRDSRIRVFHRPQRGIVLTLNEGIDLARGEWIARMDADDIALPCRFELQIEQLLRTCSDFCGGAVKCFGGSHVIWSYPESNDACGVQLLFGVPVAHPAVIGRTSAFMTLRYDSRFKHAEDYDLWQRAWTSGFQFSNLRDVVLLYRVHPKQVSTRQIEQQTKSASKVRARQWRVVLPDLVGDEISNILYAFSRGKGDAARVASGLARVLLRLPGSTHKLYLKGSLRIFIRLAGYDLSVPTHWHKLCSFTNENVWRHKWCGVLLLSFLSVARVNPNGAFFTWLRIVQNNFWLK